MKVRVQHDTDWMLSVGCERQNDGVMFTFEDGATLFLQNGGELVHVENEIGVVTDWESIERIPESYYLIADRPNEI